MQQQQKDSCTLIEYYFALQLAVCKHEKTFSFSHCILYMFQNLAFYSNQLHPMNICRVLLLLIIFCVQSMGQPGSPFCMACIENLCPEIVFEEWMACLICFSACTNDLIRDGGQGFAGVSVIMDQEGMSVSIAE